MNPKRLPVRSPKINKKNTGVIAKAKTRIASAEVETRIASAVGTALNRRLITRERVSVVYWYSI
jgi:hypothetical protein